MSDITVADPRDIRWVLMNPLHLQSLYKIAAFGTKLIKQLFRFISDYITVLYFAAPQHVKDFVYRISYTGALPLDTTWDSCLPDHLR